MPGVHRQKDAVDEQGKALLPLFLEPRKFREVLCFCWVLRFLLSLNLLGFVCRHHGGLGSNADKLCFCRHVKICFDSQPSGVMLIAVLFLIP